jgi:hypothetical protein
MVVLRTRAGIAIDLSVPTERTEQYRFGRLSRAGVSCGAGWNPLARKVEVPSIITTLLRTTEAGSVHGMRTDEAVKMADLVIHPPMEQVGLLDLRNFGADGTGLRGHVGFARPVAEGESRNRDQVLRADALNA